MESAESPPSIINKSDSCRGKEHNTVGSTQGPDAMIRKSAAPRIRLRPSRSAALDPARTIPKDCRRPLLCFARLTLLQAVLLGSDGVALDRLDQLGSSRLCVDAVNHAPNTRLDPPGNVAHAPAPGPPIRLQRTQSTSSKFHRR